MKKSTLNRILSMVLALAMSLTLCIPAFATDNNCFENSGSVTILLEGEPVNIQYSAENGYITYVKIGSDVTKVQGNVVYYNGEEIATITSKTDISSEKDTGLRTSWVYIDSCPAGATANDYSSLYSTRTHNVTFKQSIVKYSVGAILTVLVTIVPFGTEVAAETVFKNVAYVILGLAAGDISFGNSNQIYATEKIYSGGIPYTHRNDFTFYKNKQKTNVISSTSCYSYWG